MTSHSSCLCLCENNLCIDDKTLTLFLTSHLLYIAHKMHCICISPTIYDITTLYSWYQSYYFSPHTDYILQHIHCICHHTQIIDHTSPIVCMNTKPQYIWHHRNYLWHRIHSLWYHTTLWHHTYCIHVITLRIPIIASTVAGPLLIVYWLYHTYYMCDMKPTVCMTSQEFYMTSHSFFMT